MPGRSREQNISGSSGIGRHGGGIHGGGGGGDRGFGRNPLVNIIILIAILAFGGGGLESFLGGDDSGSSSSYGSFYQTAATSWTREKNTGVLNTQVADGARAKFTTLKGDGSDKVTILVYMCGADLESRNGMGTSDLKEMIAGVPSGNVNLLVYTGGAKRWNNTAVSSDVCQIFQVTGEGLKCLVSDDGDRTMTDPDTLTRFIDYGKENFPANRYELILWDHGGGSVSGYGYDEKHASAGSMPLSKIHSAVTASGVKFDAIGFDACLMATAENALSLSDCADYLIASEETEPGTGWYYTDWLNQLGGDTSVSTLELGKTIIDSYTSACESSCRGQSSTLSMTDLAEFAGTIPSALTSFAEDTTNLIRSDDYQKVSDARSGTREFASGYGIDQIDLVHLAQRLNTDASKALAQALLSTVKYNRTSDDMVNSYGLSIYFPYKNMSNVDGMVDTYENIGMDDGYTRCIQEFASLETSGQIVAQNSSCSLLDVLLSQAGLIDVSLVLGALAVGRWDRHARTVERLALLRGGDAVHGEARELVRGHVRRRESLLLPAREVHEVPARGLPADVVDDGEHRLALADELVLLRRERPLRGGLLLTLDLLGLGLGAHAVPDDPERLAGHLLGLVQHLREELLGVRGLGLLRVPFVRAIVHACLRSIAVRWPARRHCCNREYHYMSLAITIPSIG